MIFTRFGILAASGAAGGAPSEVQYLVIAGGGGAGGGRSGQFREGGGGGAGGYRSSIASEPSGGGTPAESEFAVDPFTTYTVTVGAGGVGGSFQNASTNGNPSVFESISTLGGGFGGSEQVNPSPGGSGGGSQGGNIFVATGAAGQGFDGGDAPAPVQSGAGGGGAAARGNDGVNNVGGPGGAGVSSTVTGTATSRAVGGDGPPRLATNNAGTPGDPLTGNGGDGGNSRFQASGAFIGGAGGSGVVYISYPSQFQDLLIGSGLQFRDSAGATQNGTGARVAPGYLAASRKVYEFRGGTGNVEF